MKHKLYKKPTITIVQLKQECHILAGSDRQGRPTVQDYYVNEEVEE